MGSTVLDTSSQTSIEGDLKDTGNRLLEHPSSTRELLVVLEKTESLLARVWQQPPMTTRGSLLPIMKALITEEIMHHTDVNVQVLVASCVDELSRISAPDTPYPDKNMRVFFRLFMVAFQHLPGKSGDNTSRALKIVETMAKVRSGLMLLDIEEGLVFEMFQLFLSNIRPCHPRDVFRYMEIIMSLVIQESDRISIELLKPLLDSVKKGNERSWPISFNLAKKVFQICATNVQSFLKKATEEKKLDPEDYDEIITFLVSNASNTESVVPIEVTRTAGNGASQLDGPAAKHKCCAGPSGGNGSQQPVKSGTNPDAPRGKRGRKLSSVMRPEEGYQHTLSVGGKNSAEVSFDRKNRRKKDLALPSKVGEKSMLADPSEKNEKGKRKKDLALPSQVGEIGMRAESSEKNETPKVTIKGKRKKDLASPSQVGEMSMIADPAEKNESPIVVSQGKRGRPRKKENIVSEQNDQEKLKRKETEPAKSKSSEKEKEKKSRRPHVDYGEEMINQKIQVWWPMDEMYYTGVITGFDPLSKKHTILYEDNDVEVLNLKKEEWKPFSDEQLYQGRVAKQPSHAEETLETEERRIKRKRIASKKQIASSSKRSKGESSSRVAGGNSEIDERNDETRDAGGNVQERRAQHIDEENGNCPSPTIHTNE